MGNEAKIGVIGAGWWACLHSIPQLQRIEQAKLQAVCSLVQDEVTKVKNEFGFEQDFIEHEKMLAEAQLDGVVIASPHVNHFEHAKVALEKGLHVMIEKPMCTVAAEARILEELAKEKNVEIIVPCGWNFKNATRFAKQAIKDNKIGKIEYMIVQMASALDDLFAGQGLMEADEHMYMPAASTWSDPKRAGGYGWGQLSHALTLALHISDLQPLSVNALTGKSPTGADYYDAAVVEFENNVTASVSGAATMPKDIGFKLEVRVFGTEGVLIYDIEHERMEIIRRDGKHVENQMQKGEGAYTCDEPYDQFVSFCLGENIVNDSPATIGRRSVEILDAMYRSAASGQTEEV